MPVITFGEIVDFIGDFSRPLKEGSLAMKNIVTFGLSSEDNHQVEFFALCLSSTDPRKKPYEVNVRIGKSDNNLQCTCQCKAKNLEHCKHIVGFLMVLERTPYEDIEKISKTDMTQSWGKVSEAAAERCDPSMVMNLCHVNPPVMKYPRLVIPQEVRQDIFKGLMEVFPLSILATTFSCLEEVELANIAPQPSTVHQL